jgi:hypothetical protein
MSNIFFPSLSEDGWVTDYEEIANNILAHFFASDHSQTELYLNNVSSMAYVIQNNINDTIATASEMQTTLERYLSRYLQNVVVECNELKQTIPSTSAAITLYVGFSDEKGKLVTMAKLLNIKDGKLANIVNMNNNG